MYTTFFWGEGEFSICLNAHTNTLLCTTKRGTGWDKSKIIKVTLLKFRIVFVEEETPLTYGKM